jgi:hypothetical protein
MRKDCIKGDGVVKEDGFCVRPAIVMPLNKIWGKDILKSELAVLEHILLHCFYSRPQGKIRDFLQRQSTVAEAIGYSRVMTNIAFGRITKKGFIRIKHRHRRCNKVTLNSWMRRALGKIQGALHHVGLIEHIEKFCIESIRRKHRAVSQGDSGYAEQIRKRHEEAERLKRKKWEKERNESTGWGKAMFQEVLDNLSNKISMDGKLKIHA